MFLPFICLFLCISTAQSLVHHQKSFGYGVGRLQKRSRNTHLGSTASTCPTATTQYWYTEAVIDNFAPISKQQYWIGNGQRYWIRDQFWGGKNYPVFVYINGEGEASCRSLSDRLFISTLAQEHKALLLSVEHRFYGESYPTPNMTTENLQYLSSQQALADLARVIENVTASWDTQASPVLTFGGSYPGNLAAWFRLKYPSISLGSVASSAPLLAQTNFQDYMNVVANSIVYFSGSQCYDAFESAANTVTSMYSQGLGSPEMTKLHLNFRTCDPIASELDLTTLLSNLMGNVQGVVQYNNEIPSDMNIEQMCDLMLNSTDSYQQFVLLNDYFLLQYQETCQDVSWNNTIAYIANPQMDPANSWRPWTYQTCNEFGYFQTTDSQAQPFSSWTSLNLDYYMLMCKESFDGWSVNPETAWINDVYGDISIAATNVIFPSGTIDPWSALGLTNSTPTPPQSTEEPCFILGTAHCADMFAPSPSDIPSMVWAHAKINNTVSSWLNPQVQTDDTPVISSSSSSSSAATFSAGSVAGAAIGAAVGTLLIVGLVLYFKPLGSSTLRDPLNKA